MINLKSLKSQSPKFPDPVKSILEMQKDSMQVQDFVEFFMNLRKKARELDNETEIKLKNEEGGRA